MSVYVLKNSTEMNYLGIAVSKKFSKSSVRRNRVKRLIKEVYRLNEKHIVTGNSLVILWKNTVEYDKVCFEKISEDFFKCVRKADLLYNKEEEFNV